MSGEVYCDYCDSFRPVKVTGRSLYCMVCNSIVARTNCSGLMWCGDCNQYQDADEHPVPGADADDKAWFFSDMVCAGCAGIVAALRYPAE